MSKDFSNSSCFEPIDVITLHFPWWPQIHSTYNQPQVPSIYFMRFLWFLSKSVYKIGLWVQKMVVKCGQSGCKCLAHSVFRLVVVVAA